MSRRLPTGIKVGAQHLTVKTEQAEEMERDGIDGRYRGSIALIQIRGDRPIQAIRDTLLHECLHAILFIDGICSALGLNHDKEEKLVGLLTPRLLALLRDNPQLVAYLTEVLKEDG